MGRITASSGLLETVQGLKGEELTSAVLGYLITKSTTCYRAFIECLGLDPVHLEASPTSIFSEVETKWVPINTEIPGRLDLLIDTGTRLIGIENKIWASFMDDQPVKYCAKLIEESQKLNRREAPLLVVLAPKAKNASVSKALRQVKKTEAFSSIETKSIHWTDLLNRLGSADHESVQIVLLYAELRQYVTQRIWFEDFDHAYSNLRRADEGWNIWQQKLVGYLWYAFPDPGSKVNKTKNWLGYPFFTDRDNVWGWYGFVRPNTELRGYDQLSRHNSVEFVINYRRDAQDIGHLGPHFIDVSFDERSWQKRGWLVNFDQSWSDFLHWSDSLAEVIEAIDSVD